MSPFSWAWKKTAAGPQGLLHALFGPAITLQEKCGTSPHARCVTGAVKRYGSLGGHMPLPTLGRSRRSAVISSHLGCHTLTRPLGCAARAEAAGVRSAVRQRRNHGCAQICARTERFSNAPRDFTLRSGLSRAQHMRDVHAKRGGCDASRLRPRVELFAPQVSAPHHGSSRTGAVAPSLCQDTNATSGTRLVKLVGGYRGVLLFEHL